MGGGEGGLAVLAGVGVEHRVGQVRGNGDGVQVAVVQKPAHAGGHRVAFVVRAVDLAAYVQGQRPGGMGLVGVAVAGHQLADGGHGLFLPIGAAGAAQDVIRDAVDPLEHLKVHIVLTHGLFPDEYPDRL